MHLQERGSYRSIIALTGRSGGHCTATKGMVGKREIMHCGHRVARCGPSCTVQSGHGCTGWYSEIGLQLVLYLGCLWSNLQTVFSKMMGIHSWVHSLCLISLKYILYSSW